MKERVPKRLSELGGLHSVSRRFRARRFEEFLRLLRVSPGDSILDVGGSPEIWWGSGLENGVTILNIDVPAHRPVPFRWVQGDARRMDMFGEGEFDVVFSNSVIEHVGELADQRQMADEVRRVGDRYWVQTPNKHFPIEAHFVFPFCQYLPPRLRLQVARIWPLSFARKLGLDPAYGAEHIWLLAFHDMQSLFPDADIWRERVGFLTKSLVALRVCSAHSRNDNG